jgi:hypothetical protein
VNELDVLRRLRPPTEEPDPALVADERNRLMALITRARPTDAEPDRRLRRRRRSLVAVLVAASAATAAAGWAVLQPESETTAVACGDSIVSSSTGDPVADCAALWRREKGTEPPPLLAYVGPGGGVHVLPAGEEPREGFTPLDPSFRQDASVIELEAELADVSRGLPSACYSEAEARRIVQAQLQRLGLAEWSVEARPVDFEGLVGGSCPPAAYTLAIVHPDRETVELVAGIGGSPPRELPVVELAHRLTRQLVEGPEARCVTVEEAAAVARREAASLGLSEAAREVVLHVVTPTDPAPTCARATTVVAGTAEVTVRAVPR